MNKVEGYVLQDEKTGVNYKRAYMDKASANIAITERYEKADIDAGRVRIIPIGIVSYVDLRQDIQVKEKCSMCSGIGRTKIKVKETKYVNDMTLEEVQALIEQFHNSGNIEKEEELLSCIKYNRKTKKDELLPSDISVDVETTKMGTCPVCQGKKEVWKETKAIVIY